MNFVATLGPIARFRRGLLRTAAMSAKEVMHIRRDPRTLYLALGMPLVLLLVFGYGIGYDIDHIPLVICDGDATRASRALVSSFVQSREFSATASIPSPNAVEQSFRDGTALAGLVISRGYEQALVAGRPAAAQLILDGADPVLAQQILMKADAIVRMQGALPSVGRASARPLSVQIWTRYNPSGRSAVFIVPGLAVYLLAISSVLLTALTIAGEWERGSMEQLFASPVGRLEIVLGKLFPYLMIGLLELLLVVAFGGVGFDIPFNGSPVALLAIGLLFLVGMLGLGLFISVITKNQLVATQAGAIAAILPSLLLSGTLFPIQNMPRPLQVVSLLIPARYLVHAFRGILLKGNGLDVLWPDFVAQAVFAVLVLAAAIGRFQRRLA